MWKILWGAASRTSLYTSLSNIIQHQPPRKFLQSALYMTHCLYFTLLYTDTLSLLYFTLHKHAVFTLVCHIVSKVCYIWHTVLTLLYFTLTHCLYFSLSYSLQSVLYMTHSTVCQWRQWSVSYRQWSVSQSVLYMKLSIVCQWSLSYTAHFSLSYSLIYSTL